MNTKEWNGFWVSRCNRAGLKTCLETQRGLVLLSGPRGSGKTHLLRVLAAHPRPGRSVRYLRCADLVESLVEHILKEDKESFYKSLEQEDLLVDDGAILAGTKAIWQEVLLLAERIAAQGGRMILVAEPPGFEYKACRAVFKAPDAALLQRFMEDFCRQKGLHLTPAEKRKFLCQCDRDLRQLRGILLTWSGLIALKKGEWEHEFD